MEWIKSLITPALISAVVSALISGAYGFRNANEVDQKSKVRTAQLEQIVKFVTSADALKQGVNDYISAIARQKDISPFQDSLRGEIVKQYNTADTLRTFFKDPSVIAEVDNYESSLKSFSGEIKSAVDSTTMRPWVLKFDKVYVSSKSLTAKLASSVDLPL